MSEFYYTPKSQGSASDCINVDQYRKLIDDINRDKSLTLEQAQLLKFLATRFITVRYDKLADYYTKVPANVQQWLEKLRCVIVDTDSAIKNGYIKYNQAYNKLIEDIVNEK